MLRMFPLLLLILSASAGAAGTPPPSATAKAMASAYVEGFRKMLRDNQASAAELACVERIPGTAVEPAMQSIIDQALNADERAEMERFYASPEGVRLFALYNRWGDTENALSTAELESILPLIKSGVQNKLFDATSFHSLGSVEAMQALQPWLERCPEPG
ncbi:MAG TPA: hypothetical protein VJ766_09550 [Pseudoxanthomonas sp.]|nr:hypothetical protein [Pseudoxanthomonas sp.]